LSEMIKGKRACSPAVATKLARHLGLIDNDLRDFLTAASTTCKQNLWQRGIDPTTFKNYIAEYMSKQEGVTSDDIANIHIERKGRGRDPDMVLTDKAGRQFVVEIKVTRK